MQKNFKKLSIFSRYANGMSLPQDKRVLPPEMRTSDLMTCMVHNLSVTAKERKKNVIGIGGADQHLKILIKKIREKRPSKLSKSSRYCPIVLWVGPKIFRFMQ